MPVSSLFNLKIITVLAVLITSKLCVGILNIYLDTNEVQKLLGLEAELFYIRQDVVNNYALNFVVPVPSRISILYFTWENLDSKPLAYSIAIDVSDHEALDPPQLNISSTGLVPTSTQAFSLSLPCTGIVAAEIDVIISINITLTANPKLLKLRRKKICLKNDYILDNLPISAIPMQPSSASIFYYAIVCAGLIVTTSILCVAALYIRNNKLRRNAEHVVGDQSYASFFPNTLRNPIISCSFNSFRRVPSYSLIEEQTNSKSLQERMAELSIQRCRVCLRNILLEGTFARVYQGLYTSEGGTEEEVLVKTVVDHASQVQVSLLLQEGMSMYSLSHPNILSIMGVSFEENITPLLLYPMRTYKNLKIFLQKCKLCSEGVAHTLTTQELVDMALQVIEAMNYLHKRHILHKDVAARNCVVDNRLKVQVADNALSRDLFPSDYHCLGDNENRPVKWLALESLVNRKFSTRSDVWAFGVLLWELTSLAQQPYVEIDPFEMAAYLKDGYRLSQPINCPDELFAVMAYCWAMNPQERPTFMQLQVCLKEFFMQLTRYV